MKEKTVDEMIKYLYQSQYQNLFERKKNEKTFNEAMAEYYNYLHNLTEKEIETLYKIETLH